MNQLLIAYMVITVVGTIIYIIAINSKVRSSNRRAV